MSQEGFGRLGGPILALADGDRRAVELALGRAVSDDVASRLWRRDPTLWGPAGAPEIADRLGWLGAPETARATIDDLVGFARGCRADGLRHAVVLGMGGSSLAPEVMRRSLAGGEPLELHVLDSTHPGAVAAVEQEIDLARALIVVSTKSGGTLETRSLLDRFYAGVRDQVGGAEAGSHFAAVTDPGSSLVALAEERGFRRTFVADPDVGGRFSALTPFGLVPAALAGVDLEELVDGADSAARECAEQRPIGDNVGLALGIALGALAARGRDKLTIAVDGPLASLGLWLEQLIAESTGKDGRGIVPVIGEPAAAADRYGSDRAFLVIADARAPLHERWAELARVGHPVLALDAGAGRAADLGRLFFVAEVATAVAGWLLGVNPFDQPDVQGSKDRTAQVLDRVAGGDRGASSSPRHDAGSRVVSPDEALRAGGPPEYVALMGYLAPSDGVEGAIARLRDAVRAQTGSATTFGYGPRLLHSTGQLHKGGSPTGRYVQLVDAAEPRGLAIPGAGYDFSTLIEAQADGDLEALRATGRPVARAVLDGDPAVAIDQLTARVAEA